MAFLSESDLDTHDGLLTFQTLCLEASACEPGLAHISDCISQVMTTRQCIQVIDPELRSSWTLWCRYNLASQMDEGVRLAFSDLATESDERLAAQLCVERDDLGLDEAIVQLSRWHSAMRDDGNSILPMIEAELAGKEA